MLLVSDLLVVAANSRDQSPPHFSSPSCAVMVSESEFVIY